MSYQDAYKAAGLAYKAGAFIKFMCSPRGRGESDAAREALLEELTLQEIRAFTLVWMAAGDVMIEALKVPAIPPPDA